MTGDLSVGAQRGPRKVEVEAAEFVQAGSGKLPMITGADGRCFYGLADGQGSARLAPRIYVMECYWVVVEWEVVGERAWPLLWPLQCKGRRRKRRATPPPPPALAQSGLRRAGGAAKHQ
jgi:hypothetical protein